MGASFLAAELMSSSSLFLLLLPLPEPRAPWRLVFLVSGLCVLCSGCLLFFFLLESPAALCAEVEGSGSRERSPKSAGVDTLQLQAPRRAAASAEREATPAEPRRRFGEPNRRLDGAGGDEQSRTAKDTRAERGSRREEAASNALKPSAGHLLWKAARVPGVGELCAAYFCMKLVRYLLINWLPLFLQTHLLLSPRQATWGSIFFEAGGVAGAVLVGFLADRLCSGRRFMVITPLCVLAAGCAFLLAGGESGASSQLSVHIQVLLFFLGACVAGPDSVLGGMAAADVCSDEEQRAQKDEGEERRETREQDQQQLAATASCLVNGSGSLGSILQGSATPLIVSHYGWRGVILALAGTCGAAASALLPLLARDVSQVFSKRRTAGRSKQ